MSTLCAYENYLRDRYVLGQSVHYAAGSNSPKPKSYDREGNEYVWSDEAGDYVRQVGGPGGGRTIRLSEVEKAEIEQPQSEQVNADSGQRGSEKEATSQGNVDYSEFTDAYKRYRAEDKKVASLKRKASKIQKAVSAPSSGATPEEIQSARESLAKIRGEISDSEEIKASLSSGLNSFTKKHNVVFVDGGNSFVVNPSPELLQGLKQRKRLQDSVKKARKKAEEAKKAGLKTNASEIASIADKLEGELNSVNDLLSQMFPNETVVSAVDEPKNEQADLLPKRKNIGINSFGRYAPTSRDVEDFLRLGKSALEGKSAAVAKGIKRYLQGAGVIDSSLGLTPLGQMLKEDRLRAAPYALINLVYNDPQIRWFYERYGDGGYHQFEDVYHDLVDAGYSKNVAKELVAGYKKFVADPALDVFPVGRLVDKKTFQIESTAPFVKSEHAVYALYRFSDKFLDGRPGFRLSVLNQHPLSPFNVFQVDREGAKPLLHGATSAYPGLIYASFMHDLEKISLLRENIGSGDVFRELTSKTETGKTDETTKEPEESDAQFDASGLGLPGKSDVALKPDGIKNKDAAYFVRRDLEGATREAKTAPQNQDDVASEPLSDSDYWERAQASLPNLRGTEKQVKWADDIRKKAFNRFYWVGAWTLLRNKSYLHAKQYSRDISKYMVDEAIRQFFGSRDSAKFWIDNREDIDRVVNDSLLRICFNLDKNNWEPTQEQIKESDRKEALAHKNLDTSLYRSQTNRERSIDSVDGRKFAEKHLSRIGQLSDRQEAVDVAKSLKNIAYYSATKGDVDVVTLCKDGVSKIKDMFGTGRNDDVLQEWTEKLDRELARANKNQQKLARKKTQKENVSVEERVEASPENSGGENGDQAARLDDAGNDASLERKVKESLSKGTPLLKRATRLRSKAKDAALKGRKEEAAGLRKQADEIEAEARKSIDEAVNAGVELKNRRAQALPSSEERPAEETRAIVSTKQLPPDEGTEENSSWRSYMLRLEKEARTDPEGISGASIDSLWNGGMALNARGDFKFATRARDALVDLSKRLTGDNASRARRRADSLSGSIERAKRYHEKYGKSLLSPTREPQSDENSGPAQPVVSEQQTNLVAEPAQKQPAKPRPERWTPLKSKMNDDDRRVIENTRKRLNYGLSELAWRLGNAKEKGDVQRVKQLVATAANHYLEQARRAYRSHGGTEALAAFDETLGGDGLTVGQLRDRVVDKFRKIAQMEANDLFKFAGERLDEFESFAEADSEPISNKEIHLNSIRDKNGKWETLDDKDSELAVEDGKPTTLFPDEHFGRRMGSERGLADAVRRALKSMTRKGEYRDSFENSAEYVVPKYNIDTPTRMGRFLAHGYKDSLDGKPVSRDDYSEQRYQELLEKFPTDRESRKLNNLFNSNNREVNKLIKENEDEYKQSKNKSEVVQRVVDGIRDILLERRQNGSAEAPPSESLRSGATGEVLETGGADRPFNGGDGRNPASVIAEEAQKSDIPESRVREELDTPRQSKISPDSQKAVQSLRNLIQRVYGHDGLAERIKSRATSVFGDTLSAPGETGFESTGEHDKHLFALADKLDKAKKKLEKAQERFDENPDSEKLERAVDKAENTANEIEDRLARAVDKFVQLHGGKSKDNPSASVAKTETSAFVSTPQKNEKPDWLAALESQEELKPVSRGKYNAHAKPYSWEEDYPVTEDELRAYWQEHIDGGEAEEFTLGSNGKKITIGEHSGDEPMTLDELRRFAQLRHGREFRQSLERSENFTEKELKELQDPSEKRGQGRPSKTTGATQKVSESVQRPDSLEEFSKPRIDDELLDKKVLELNTPRRPARQKPQGGGWTTIRVDLPDDDDEGLSSNKAPSPSEKIAREAQKSEVPKEQVQERIAEAVHGNSNTRKPQTASLQEPGGSNAANTQALPELKQQSAGAEPLDKDVVQDRIAEAVAGGDASKRKRNLQHSTKPQDDSLLDNKRENNISDEVARRRIAKDNLDSFVSAFNSIPKKAPSYWLARQIVNKINDRMSFDGHTKTSVSKILENFVKDQRMREFYSTGPSRLDSAAKDLASRLGIERGASHDYFDSLITDLDRAWLKTNPENVGPHDIASYRNGTHISPISPKKKVNRSSNRSSKNFNPDSVKDDVQKAVQIRDADRNLLADRSIESIMQIAQKVAEDHKAKGLKTFMKGIDVVPTEARVPNLLKELRDSLEDYALNRYKAWQIREELSY